MQLGYLYPLRYKEDGSDSLGTNVFPEISAGFLVSWGLALSIS